MTRLFYTQSGHLFAHPAFPPDQLIDLILATGYAEEVCVADDWSPAFAAGLMFAGFLLMSTRLPESGACILLPKHHQIRSVLFFEDTHIGRTVRRVFSRYELNADDDAAAIARACAAVHGADWLTPPLLSCFDGIAVLAKSPVRPMAFGLYRNGKRVAGEFGMRAGNVYTSYSGYFEESGAGRAQMILSANWLRENGFAFWDLGMPLPYKYTLGARDLSLARFTPLFRRHRHADGGAAE